MFVIFLAFLALIPSCFANLNCHQPVGIEDGTIPNQSMTASSSYNRFHGPSQARLNNVPNKNGVGAWCPAKSDKTPYLQVDLGKFRNLGYLLTQGRDTRYAQYVKQYTISHSRGGTIFTPIRDVITGKIKVFPGNFNKNTPALSDIRPDPLIPLDTRYVRIYPLTSYGNMCMRIELHECSVATTSAPQPTTAPGITCPPGHRLGQDNKTCEDVDECTESKDQCDKFSTTCINNKGSYTCLCKSGYKPNPASRYRCQDINECTDTNHGCNQKCNNNQGSFRCACNDGYKLDQDGKTCNDINECSTLHPTHHCQPDTTTCGNTNGGYECRCKMGYKRKDTYSCQDKNECSNGEARCDLVSSYCINRPGSYLCLCRRGYDRPDGSPLDPLRCQDVNECAYKNGGCSHGCQNLNGTFLCTCPVGYELSTSDRYKCVDKNECLLGNGNCQHNCRNSAGSYSCTCKAGFRLEGKYKCKDINECTDGSAKCDIRSTICQNNQPFYQCNCKPGFRPISSNIYKCEAKTCAALTAATGTVISPPRCLQHGGPIVNDACKFSCQPGYKLPAASASSITCLDSGKWSGITVSCTKKSCPELSAPSNGKVWPDFCSTRGNVYQEKCFYQCNHGYAPAGTSSRTCQASGEWSPMQQVFSCKKVYPKPTISCPRDVSINLMSGASTADVSALLEQPTSNVKQISVSPTKYKNYFIFPAGTTELTYTATNQNGETASCRIVVSVIDKEPPKYTGCPANIFKVVKTQTAAVTWTPPTFTDNVAVISTTSSKKPGDIFTLGTLNVHYTARDAAGNPSSCSFSVTLKKAQCEDPPQPDGGVLRVQSFNGFKFASITCNAGKEMFQFTWSITCDANTLKWGVIPDCVDSVPIPGSGVCPQRYVKQTSLVGMGQKNICVKCPHGYFYDTTKSDCVKCAIGSFSGSEGSLSCTACAKGQSTLAVGAKTCTAQCSPGSASGNGFHLPSQQMPCEKCRKGFYEDRYGSIACKACPTGKTTLLLGSTRVEDCGGAPTISQFSSSPVNATEHKPVELMCRGSGVPLPTFKVKKVKAIPDGFGGPVQTHSIVDSNNNVVGIRYVITKTTEHDAGYYSCEAESSFGKAMQYYKLNVQLIFGPGGRR